MKNESGGPIVIGAVGLNGSGKDMVLQRLESAHRVPLFSMGDVARNIAKQRDLAATRENLHQISEEFISKYGMDYFPTRIMEEIASRRLNAAGVSGIRTPEDVKAFREQYGDNFILIHVEVRDDRLRFARTRTRGEERDDLKFHDFRLQDHNEERLFKLSKTIALATETIKNEGTLDDLYTAVDTLAERLCLPEMWRQPKPS